MDKATLYCPVCGQPLELTKDESGEVVCRKTCSTCMNEYLILLTSRGTLAITSENIVDVTTSSTLIVS